MGLFEKAERITPDLVGKNIAVTNINPSAYLGREQALLTYKSKIKVLEKPSNVEGDFRPVSKLLEKAMETPKPKTEAKVEGKHYEFLTERDSGSVIKDTKKGIEYRIVKTSKGYEWAEPKPSREEVLRILEDLSKSFDITAPSPFLSPAELNPLAQKHLETEDGTGVGTLPTAVRAEALPEVTVAKSEVVKETKAEVPLRRIRTRALPYEERRRLYEEAIRLRREYGWGYRRISRKLSISPNTVDKWIYHGTRPRNPLATKERLLAQIKDAFKENFLTSLRRWRGLLPKYFGSIRKARELAYEELRKELYTPMEKGIHQIDLNEMIPKDFPAYVVDFGDRILLWRPRTGLVINRFIDRDLFHKAVSLYAGEGTKIGNSVIFSNSVIDYHRTFINFLDNLVISPAPSDKKHGRVYISKDKDPEKAKEYWSIVSGIPKERIKHGFVPKCRLEHGNFHTIFANVILKELLDHWIKHL